jgi:hypothetical protein
MDHSLSTYFKWILSFIFVAAGVLKIFSPENTGDILIFLFEVEYNTSLVIVYVIATIEVVMGFLLFFEIKEKTIRVLILFTCCLFLAIAVLGFSNGWEFACGCFGKFSFGRFDLAMLLRNSLLVFMSLWLIYSDSILKILASKEVINQQSKIGVNHED